MEIPKYTKPDILQVDISMNGKDYTNDHVTYGFYDAFVLDVTPRLISRRGGTRLSVIGFGFVNSGSSDQRHRCRDSLISELTLHLCLNVN